MYGGTPAVDAPPRRSLDDQPMADPTFHSGQRAGIRSGRVARVNAFIDDLRRDHPSHGIPYIPPHYDANNARLLILSSNPGPKATESEGSGFLSRHNRDFSALARALVRLAIEDQKSGRQLHKRLLK